MRFTICLLTIVALCSCWLNAQTPNVVSLDLQAIDNTVDPCVDFHQYACGGWFARHPMPNKQRVWGPFYAVAEHTDQVLKAILEDAAQAPRTEHSSEKIGDYYAACSNEEQANAQGAKPLTAELQRISAVRTKQQLIVELAHMHEIGVNVLFKSGVTQDDRDATRMLLALDQGGIHLPDRDYYLQGDPKFAQIRQAYLNFTANLFRLSGDSVDMGKKRAEIVLRLETALAEASLDRVSRRDPANTYHASTIDDLDKSIPALGLREYLRRIGVPSGTPLNLADPGFFKSVDTLWQATSLEDLKTYFTWSYIVASSAQLSDEFERERFRFYGQTFGGVNEDTPRWQRCVRSVDRDLGDALGQEYVRRAFSRQSKEATLKIAHDIEHVLESEMKESPWTSPSTQRYAITKLHAVVEKVGYPEKWRDYSGVEISRQDNLGNSERCKAFEFHRNIGKLGKPVDRTEWYMTPPTVNAYYDPQTNSINFPAARLQPPWYDPDADAAVNYGGIGSVIGHELTHGFDDQGRRYDANGSFADWWKADDAKQFGSKAECFVEQYDAYTVAGGAHLNGSLTLGENIADNDGLRLAFLAFLGQSAASGQSTLNGYTPQQRFFLNFAQTRCSVERDQFALTSVRTDHHSPGKYRVNGTVSNMPEFQAAFACKVGQPMVRANACRIW